MAAIQGQAAGTVEVCAIYLPGRDEDDSVLLDGIGVADPADLAGLLIAPDTKILGV